MHKQSLDSSLTLRLAHTERQRLDEEATLLGLSTAAYVRCLTADASMQDKLLSIIERQQNRKHYAQILRVLGESRIANNLNQIAYAMHTGTFVFTPDVIHQINECNEAIIYIRRLLIENMGVKVR